MNGWQSSFKKLFNTCYKEGTFTQDLKLAKVIPIFKNRGDIKDISNYRPISMLSIFSKLFEKLIHKRLLDYFVKNNLFNPSQYGFRPGHSTQHALINATENVYNSLDMNLYTIGIFIDFSIRLLIQFLMISCYTNLNTMVYMARC